MSTIELKSELIRLIDSFDREEDLQDLYDSVLDFAEQRSFAGQPTLPRLGGTSPERMAVLERALQQAKEGRTKTHEEFLKEMKQWRTK